jgi:hypothetical protein
VLQNLFLITKLNVTRSAECLDLFCPFKISHP